HQTFVHNRLTRTNFTARLILAVRAAFERLKEPLSPEQAADQTRRLRQVADELIEALLWVDEAPLGAKLSGTSGFEQRFAAAGPRDRQGRSLRDFDLTRRVFRYPCSYVIYSAAFDALPSELRDIIWQRLGAILRDPEPPLKYDHLSVADRTAIREILLDTKPQLPESWRRQP
ncbi:MAG: hypothetical protein JNM18_07370, partial [Planctomycetaceae bacterium]|nr:hypothetical protein [Planctomycetaceae bacterium]